MLVCHIYVSADPIFERPSATQFFSNCIGVPLVFVLYFGYKFCYKTKIVSVDMMDLVTDRVADEELLEQEEKLDEYYRMTRGKRALTYVRF
jgi:amino acid permease